MIERVRGNGRVDLVTHSGGANVALASHSEHVENLVMMRENEKHLAKILFAPGDGTALADRDAMLFCSGHRGLAADPSVHRAMIRALRE